MKNKKSILVSFCGLMAALGVVLMLACGAVPLLVYTAPLFAGLLLIPTIVEMGMAAAWMVWAVTGMLILLLGVDKEAGCFYLFFGFYPVLKRYLDRISVTAVRIIVKIIIFAVLNMGMYAVLIFVFRLEAVMKDFTGPGRILNIVLSQSMLPVLLIYDFLVNRMTGFYLTVIRTKINR